MDDESRRMSAEEARLHAALLDLAAGDIVAVEGGILTKVHAAVTCAGEHCWVHNPSAHSMSSWPVRWRSDKGTAERVCPHGIGHPDPDDVSFHTRMGRDVTLHGCDGCCASQ